jgi:serine O-acetyltransferase
MSDDNIAEKLVASYGADGPLAIAFGHELPSRHEVHAALSDLRELIFPGFSGATRPKAGVSPQTHVEALLTHLRVRLGAQIYRGLHHRCSASGDDCGSCQQAAERITDGVITSLPRLRDLLLHDVRAVFAGDPAATGTDEVVFSYPGISAITVYRIAHKLYELGAVIVPRMMTEIAHGETGIDIHPAATIGEGFFIDHGTGVVIGATTIIGNHVRIYQGVTLGALSLPTGKARQLASTKRHPTIEDDVIIYANATILGGETVIGKGAVIGGNSWITESVPSPARKR